MDCLHASDAFGNWFETVVEGDELYCPLMVRNTMRLTTASLERGSGNAEECEVCPKKSSQR